MQAGEALLAVDDGVEGRYVGHEDEGDGVARLLDPPGETRIGIMYVGRVDFHARSELETMRLERICCAIFLAGHHLFKLEI